MVNLYIPICIQQIDDLMFARFLGVLKKLFDELL